MGTIFKINKNVSQIAIIIIILNCILLTSLLKSTSAPFCSNNSICNDWLLALAIASAVKRGRERGRRREEKGRRKREG